jgi:TatD DNase family protein
MIDTHSHLDADVYDKDRDEVIERSFSSGVEKIIVPAIEPDNFENVLNLALKYENIFCGIGIHPHSANQANAIEYQKIIKFCGNKKVVAVGEIGLDYFYNFSTPEVQKTVFRRQIQIAKEMNLPVIVHNRESDSDLISILKDEQDGTLNGVMHCFSGGKDFLKETLDLGFYISFTGNISFKKFNDIEMVQTVPNNRFMLETDSPYMTPVPNRGKRNEPLFVKLVAEKLAEIKSLTFDEVVKMTSDNAKKLFKLTLLVFFLIVAGFAQNLNAQSVNKPKPVQDDNTIAEEEEEEEDIYSPFHKHLGIGFILGTNTIVESYTPNPKDQSYEGLVAYGGTVHYSAFNFLIVTGSYVYSKNNKLLEKDPNAIPNVHQQIELTSNFIINPHSRINFFGMIGLSYLMNAYAKPDTIGATAFLTSDNRLGINSGLGFYINIPIKSAGTFTIVAEWKLNFSMGKTSLPYDPRKSIKDPLFSQHVELSSFFSIPRLSIVWFPEFLFEN